MNNFFISLLVISEKMCNFAAESDNVTVIQKRVTRKGVLNCT